MNILHDLRRSRALTFLELAHLAGIPARTLAEAEYGLHPLSVREREKLAEVLDVPADALLFTAPLMDDGPGTLAVLRQPALLPVIVMAALLIVLGVSVVSSQPFLQVSYTVGARPAHARVAAEGPALRQPPRYQALTTPTFTPSPLPTFTATPLPTFTPTPLPTHTPTPDPTVPPTAVPTAPPVPALPATAIPLPFELTQTGPRGCPLQPMQGRVVMTQGYGVGTHNPAEIWGAVDLAVIDPAQGGRNVTKHTPVVATHDGVATVSLDSWPGGNHVSIQDPVSGWRTGYAHLDVVFVESGQAVTAGNYIGLAGETGKTTGPHLDYQVWYGGTNIDPTGLVVGCH